MMKENIKKLLNSHQKIKRHGRIHLLDYPFNIILLAFQNSAKKHFYFFSHGMQNSIEIFI